jgi:hypothetical protein
MFTLVWPHGWELAARRGVQPYEDARTSHPCERGVGFPWP